MARAIFIPSTNYPAGTISRSVDSFPADVRELRATFTRESWPAGTVLRVTVLWSDGSGARAEFPGGVVLDRSGAVATTSSIFVRVPRDSSVLTGDFTIQALQPLRTAITLEAR